MFPPRRRTHHHFEVHPSRVRLPHQDVQRRLVAMHPRRRQHLVQESPAQPHGPVQAPVLIERVQRLRVGLETAPELRVCAGVQVLAERARVTERTPDPARPLDEQRRRDGQRAAPSIQLKGLLGWTEIVEAALPALDAQRTQQRPDTDSADDVVRRESFAKARQLSAHERLDRPLPDVHDRDGFRACRRIRMNEHATQRSQLGGMRRPFTLEPLLVRRQGRWIGTLRRPLPEQVDSRPHGLSRGSHRVVGPVERPPPIVQDPDGVAAVPELRRLGTQQAPLAADRHERQDVAGRHRSVVCVEHRDSDTLGRPRPGHALTPGLVKRRDGQRPVR